MIVEDVKERIGLADRVAHVFQWLVVAVLGLEVRALNLRLSCWHQPFCTEQLEKHKRQSPGLLVAWHGFTTVYNKLN